MASTFAVSLSKWSLDLATKFIKADVRLHNPENVQGDMSVVFVVNHFTRIETLLLPYILHKHTGREVWSLAAGELFSGRIGQYLKAMGTMSTEDPDRDKTIINSLLKGVNPWIIFPEGAMIKDKKVVNAKGDLAVNYAGVERPPHTGAAVMALRAEFYRQYLKCLVQTDNQDALAHIQNHFNLEDVGEVLAKRTVIIPVNITYFPIRAHENFFLRMAKAYAKDLSPRAVEELSVEGTVLSEDSDIDITLGEPISILSLLRKPEFSAMLNCSNTSFDELEQNIRSIFHHAAAQLTQQFMHRIYNLTTINYDHIFATLIRYQGNEKFTERAYRNRIFLCAHELNKMGKVHMHGLLKNYYRSIVYEDPSPKFHEFMELSLKEGILLSDGKQYYRNAGKQRDTSDFHSVRWNELTYVMANEIEPLSEVVNLIRSTARLPRFLLSKRIRDIFLREDQQQFEQDYARYYDADLSKSPEVGRPFLLKPIRPKGGIVLTHGYMAAPQEIRALADHLYQQGYAVYGVRLKGHGTAPMDLAQTTWKDWYESLNRGYAIIKSLTDNIILGGFSTGGSLTMLAAAQKGKKVNGVFSICAPLQLRNYSTLLTPSVMSFKSLLKRFGRDTTGWDFVENHPENTGINYTKNPISGLSELMSLMTEMENALPRVKIPALIVQSSGDPTVNPVSAQLIFDRLSSPDKELALISSERHGIINGEGREKVFQRVSHFLDQLPRREVAPEVEIISQSA